MKRVKCEMVERRSTGLQEKIPEQLKGMVNEMRNLSPPPGQGVSNIDGGSIWDCRLPGTSMWHGPFKTVHDFHKYLRGGLDTNVTSYPNIGELIDLQDRTQPPPVFIHSDLSSLNTLVHGDNIVLTRRPRMVPFILGV